MNTAWSHLPNAPHIDRILSDIKANPDRWVAAWDAARRADWNAAWDAAWDKARNAARDAARDAALVAAKYASWDAARYRCAAAEARYAIAALIAWDRAGSYLSLTPDKVKTLAYLGDEIAILMLPATVALNDIKETA